MFPYGDDVFNDDLDKGKTNRKNMGVLGSMASIKKSNP